jgi:hypothetical protein
MSASDPTGPLSTAATPEFFSPKSGAAVAGVCAHTIRANITPDATVWSTTGKPFPLYTRQTLAAYAAERKARDGAA